MRENMIKYINQTQTFREFLLSRKDGKKNHLFFSEYARRAKKYINTYPSKYLACFAFDGDTARILTHGSPEKEELECVFGYLKANNLIHGQAIDVGANYGMHSLRFSEYYEHVYAFEPHPAVYKLLDFNTSYNNPKSNISIFNYGISSEESEMTLYDYKGQNIGGSTFELRSVKDHDNAIKFECTLKPLDDEGEIRNKDIGLLKIDTEGHELSVLKGAENFISEQKPVILMEDWFSSKGNESDSIKFLRKLGYKNFLVPETYPNRRKLSKFGYLAAVFLKGHISALVECDFSAPKGYDLIVCHV